MWKGGGRSSALDRAQALLAARSSRGDAQSSTTRTQGSLAGSLDVRSAPQNTHTLLSDLSDLSSVSSASEPGRDAGRCVNPENSYVTSREVDSNKDARPPSSLGGRSRFLKRAPPPTTSSQSPVSRNQVHEPRYVSSSQRGSQTATLSRLAEIESLIRSRKRAQEQVKEVTKPVHDFTSDTRTSSPPSLATQSPGLPVHPPTKPGSNQSPRGNRFLKKKTVGATEDTPKSADVSIRPRTGNPVASSGETKSVRIMNTVSLESDEEDMRKLLGESMDSTDHSLTKPERPFSTKESNKMFSKSSLKGPSSSPLAAVRPTSPSIVAPPRSPSSPSHRSSPFRFTGQSQAHFSPSMLSPSPSPPRVSTSPPLERLGSSPRIESPGRSVSSVSGRGAVLSLEELFPVGHSSEDLHSVTTSVSEDFRINVMTLDDLVPAAIGFTAETSGTERGNKDGPADPECQDGQQLPKEEEEEVLDYQSDFESESRTGPDHSSSQVSEHLQGYEEEEVSEVREEDSDASFKKTEDDYSSDFSDTSHTYTSWTSDHKSSSSSQSRDFRSSVTHRSCASSQQMRRRDPHRKKSVKEAAVQTQPAAHTWSTGSSYLNPTPVVTHTVSAERMEAISGFNPAIFTLNELLKQQLTMTRRFIESSRNLHSSLMQSLEPPNYRYTTLEDTKEYIGRCRPPKLTMEKALEEVLQETRHYNHT